MEWSGEQERALLSVSRWYKDKQGQQVFRLFGFAGTGKTTLAKQIAKDIGGDVLFCTYTGKAALVLRQKGCEASTIHSLIYNPKCKSVGKLKDLKKELEQSLNVFQGTDITSSPTIMKIKETIRAEEKNLDRPSFTLNTDSLVRMADLVIVDECSMVDEIIGKDLLSFETKVLVLGDPAQLPPVRGTGFFISEKPDFLLTEIHRQAADNPIIRMATMIRNGETLPLGHYGESRVVTKLDIDPMEAALSEQIIVGKNVTRHATNNRVRDLLKIGNNKLPVAGDKIVCLRNDHEKGLLNGALFYVREMLEEDESLAEDFLCAAMRIAPSMSLRGGEILVDSHLHHFLGREGELQWFERCKRQEFDYGYALTAHKSQGSQWKDVLVFDESLCFRESARRWLYTAVTRAEERVTVVRV